MPLYHHKINTGSDPDSYVPSGISIPSGAIFYAPLSESSPTAETGQTLTAYGSPSFTTYKSIPCLYANGASGIQITNATTIPQGNNPMSLSAFFCPMSTMWDYATVAAFGILNYNQWFSLMVDPSDCLFSALFGNDNGSAYAVAQGQWYHAAVTFDSSSGAHSIYANGQLVASRTTEKDTAGSLGGIGFSGVDGSRFFAGYISSVRLYDRALSQAEVAALSQEFVPKPTYSSLNFDEFGHPVRFDSADDAGCSKEIEV